AAMEKVLKVKMGMPKHRQLMRLMEDPSTQRALDKFEMSIRSDQNRGVFQDFKEGLYFTIDEKHHDTELSEMGRSELRPKDPDSFVLPDLSTGFQTIDDNESLDDDARHANKEELQALFDERSETIHNISQLLRAYCLYERDDHYIVVDNKVVIVDEFTGRSMPGRRFGEGLHQALEAKEEVTIERETQTLATVTIQNYFRMYDKLAGMTGTAETEAGEFMDIYKLDVAVVPTNRPCIRVDEDDRIFRTRQEKFRAIIEDVKERHATGQPILLGTVSVQVSETLSRMLQREKIAHNVLNAKNHAREAEIVENAGQLRSITIATNMAGRGTDIRLGPGVPELGGLCVIGSGRHDSRRVDRQLRGRCSRQGDAGVSRFYISLEDDLMRLFGSDRIAGWMQRMGMKDGEELSHPWLNRSIESAQRKVEQQHFSSRKRVLQYDDVGNKQRSVIYGRRRDILLNEEPRKLLFDYVYNTVFDRIESSRQDPRTTGSELDIDGLLGWLQTTFPIGLSEADLELDGPLDSEALADSITDKVDEAYKRKERGEDLAAMSSLERAMMLNPHDQNWQMHIDDMDQLRQGVHLHSHAQKDPLVIYKREGFVMFENLIDRINEEICSNMFRSATSLEGFRRMLMSMPTQEVHSILGQFSQEERAAFTGQPQTQTMAAPGEPAMQRRPESEKIATYRRSIEKVGRNDPCSCGSGRKFKKCCGK
ncbi:MAG: preprotein translocase subunit SecA, partial [Rhodothermales bacterium]